MNSGVPSSSASSNSGASNFSSSNIAADWLALAIRRGHLTPQQTAELTQQSERGGFDVRQLAVERGWVTPIERDIIEALVDPVQVAPGYRVLDVIGHGGLGIVYKAQQINLDRPVALKTVLVTRLNTPGALARFQQEAKTIGALRHPNIVTAFDSGTHAGRLFLAMELVEGVDLAQLIQLEKRLDEFRGLWIARQIAGGLAHAAEQNIVHRDIKPANILMTKTPHGYPLPSGVPLAKITDFGLALLAAENDDTRLTLAGTTMGTPHYMAPEQLRGSTVDLRADIFALGATLYHLLTGKAPYAGSTITDIVASRMRGTRRPIQSVADHLSEPTVRLVEEMMAEDPADRPANYAQLIARIDEALHVATPPIGETGLFVATLRTGASHATHETDSAADPTRTMASVPTAIPPALPSTPVARRASWGKRVALLAIALVVVSAGVWAVGRLPHRPSTADEAPAASSTGRETPLFDGRTLAGWEPRFRGSWGQGRDSEGGFVLQGRATPAQAASIVRELPTPDGRPLDDFRVQLGVDARAAQRVEILFGTNRAASGDAAVNRQGAHGVLLEKDSARVGTFNNESHFEPTATADLPSKPNQDGPVYRNLKIDHHAGHWRVYIDDKLIGKLPAGSSSDGNFWISLVVEQGTANFENLQLVELTITATN